ncbi:benzyl alcohol O-benzoyltransferase-like [Panicum miliaceum]|uniref:Benzyl alcohol O-benzoyltransferase-like n=1 Tax=Panicum miliaceum TaxID=4540 RepID=A0A3L6SUB2_PANMI|nr:benzyl alcohol O-benzoyltransferase-like [Panicum miliaceum]
MSVVVSKSSPVTTTIKLSSFDKGLERMPAAALLVFEHLIHETTETIKRALSQALVHYYPFAGRMVAGADGDDAGHIHCSGEGAVFVAASASCAVEEVIASDHSPASRSKALREDLAVRYPGESCGPADPLLVVQVTEFSCGGFVLGVAWNHAVADGAGMAQFLQAIGELARGLPSPSVAPVRRDDSLPSLPAVVPIDKLLSLDPFDDLAYLDFTVPSSAIRRIRTSAAASAASHAPFSTPSAPSCGGAAPGTRAVMSDPEAPAVLFFSANERRHVGAKQGYYGNCVTAQLVTEKSGAVAGGDVVELAKKIRDAKET